MTDIRTLPHFRECVLTVEEKRTCGPFEWVAKMKAAGIKFKSEVCPIKIAQPYVSFERDDGATVWQQWDAEWVH